MKRNKTINAESQSKRRKPKKIRKHNKQEVQDKMVKKKFKYSHLNKY